MMGGGAGQALLLDTCAVIWFANGNPMSEPSKEAIIQARQFVGVLVSPISAWEIGLLCRPRFRRAGPEFLPDPKAWFDRVMSEPGIRGAAFTPAIAVDASLLPGNLHNDPADRIIIATARHLNMPIVTRDRRIIDYARAGHVAVIPC